MGYYHVERPEREGAGAFEIVAIALVMLALLVLAFSAVRAVPVTVDGVRYDLPFGTPVGTLREMGLAKAGPGDLVSIGNGSVLGRGEGEPVTLFVDGRPVKSGERIIGPVRVESVAGGDVVEAVDVVEEPITIPILYEGEGSLVSLAQTGHTGTRVVSRGAVSGQLLEAWLVEEAVPMILRRQHPAASGRVIALTFDDGPWPGQTDAILDILAEEDAKATFFLLGVQVRKEPGLARRIADEGHVLGNHTQTHRILRRSTAAFAAKEMETAQATIVRATGVRPVWFRAPGGLAGASVYEACGKTGLVCVRWTVDPQDWTGKSAEDITTEVLSAVQPGAIVLLHDGGGDRSATVEALPGIVSGLRAKGYVLVTLDEMLGLGGP